MPNPFEKAIEPEPEIELDSLGRKKGKFDRRITVNKNPYRNARGIGARLIYNQIKEPKEMGILPIELVAYVKLLYSQKYGWAQITDMVRKKFPQFHNIQTTRLRSIYVQNQEAFKEARQEFESQFQEGFHEQKDRLFITTLEAELKIAETLSDEVERLTNHLPMIDIVEHPKQYMAVLGALTKAQEKLAELTNTGRLRRLEENKMLLEQRKLIEGTLKPGEETPKETKINIIGSEDAIPI